MLRCFLHRILFQTMAVDRWTLLCSLFVLIVSAIGDIDAQSCGNTVYTEPSGTITSPNYPENYNTRDNCTYAIQASQTISFYLTFQAFHLEESADCRFDWIQIGCKDGSTLTPKYCGPTIPPPIVINSCNEVLVWFHSDDSQVYSGFSLQYSDTPYASTTKPATEISTTSLLPTTTSTTSTTATSESTTTPTTIISTTTSTTMTSATSRPTTVRSTTSTTATPVCGHTVYTEPSGTITSPNYPGNYNSNDNCTYAIQASESSSFNMTFQAFNLESLNNCQNDWVQIGCKDSSYVTPKYCGPTIPPPIVINSCNEVLVWFHSDDSQFYSGFSLQYSYASATKPTTEISTTSLLATTTPTATTVTTGNLIVNICEPYDDVPFIVVTTLLVISSLGYIVLATLFMIHRNKQRTSKTDAKAEKGARKDDDYYTIHPASGVLFDNISV